MPRRQSRSSPTKADLRLRERLAGEMTGKVLRAPERTEIDTPVSEQLIVELYSK